MITRQEAKRRARISDYDRNLEILAERQENYTKKDGPRVGDWVIFPDDIERRISYVWNFDDNPQEWGIQTSQPHSSYFLGDSGYMSFSGSLYMSVKFKHFILEDYTKDGNVWFFNRAWPGAGRGVNFTMPCKVWKCSVRATTV